MEYLAKSVETQAVRLYANCHLFWKKKSFITTRSIAP
jgi:hypothetical protein